MNPWWYVLGGVIALLDLAIVGVFAVAALVPEAVTTDGRGAAFFAAFAVDTSRVEPGIAVIVWVTRILIVAVMLIVVASMLLTMRLRGGRRRRR